MAQIRSLELPHAADTAKQKLSFTYRHREQTCGCWLPKGREDRERKDWEFETSKLVYLGWINDKVQTSISRMDQQEGRIGSLGLAN